MDTLVDQLGASPLGEGLQSREAKISALRRPPTSTKNVVECIIKPRTQQARCCYLDLLSDAERDEKCGAPQEFISHAWKGNFVQLLEAVCASAEGSDEPLAVWIDVFSINQHALTTASATSPVQGLAAFEFKPLDVVIGQTTRTRVFLDSLDIPAPFSRLWCLYECLYTLRIGGELEVMLPPGAANHLSTRSRDEFLAIIQNCKAQINCETADCWGPDRDRIRRAIVEDVGFDLFQLFCETFFEKALARLWQRLTGHADWVLDMGPQIRALRRVLDAAGTAVAGDRVLLREDIAGRLDTRLLAATALLRLAQHGGDDHQYALEIIRSDLEKCEVLFGVSSPQAQERRSIRERWC